MTEELCSIDGCEQPLHYEGVCFFHYPLWEAWGYGGGYEVYMKYGRKEGRRQFAEWLDLLNHQDIVDILSGTDWKLAQATIESMEELLKTPVVDWYETKVPGYRGG